MQSISASPPLPPDAAGAGLATPSAIAPVQQRHVYDNYEWREESGAANLGPVKGYDPPEELLAADGAAYDAPFDLPAAAGDAAGDAAGADAGAAYDPPSVLEQAQTVSVPESTAEMQSEIGSDLSSLPVAPVPPAPASSEWNDRLQRIFAAFPVTPGDITLQSLRANQLVQEFVQAQGPVVKVIVEEALARVPLDRRTYKPIQIGGLAGGVKFMHNGVLFKFAVDSAGLYGSDEFAAKVAGHELRGLNAILGAQVRGLHFPLMVVFEYLGVRITAAATLPINSDTLRYGSADAGVTVKTDPRLHQLFQRVGSSLNLAPHPVGAASLCLGGDVEGHLGADGRNYVVDTARVFPPAAPASSTLAVIMPISTASVWGTFRLPIVRGHAQGVSALLHTTPANVRAVPARDLPFVHICYDATSTEGPNEAAMALASGTVAICGQAILVPQRATRSILFQFLRPEAVATNSVPLSADALSGWGAGDRQQFDPPVVQATERVFLERIPELATKLDATGCSGDWKGAVHSMGVNFRYLGLVRGMCNEPRTREALLIELIARCFRRELYARVAATVRSTSSDAVATSASAATVFLRITADLLNSRMPMVGEVKQNSTARQLLKLHLHARFMGCLANDEWQPDVCLWSSLSVAGRKAVFERVNQLCNIRLAATVSAAGKPRYSVVEASVSSRPICFPQVPPLHHTRTAAVRGDVEGELAAHAATLGPDHPLVAAVELQLCRLSQVDPSLHIAAQEHFAHAKRILVAHYGEDTTVAAWMTLLEAQLAYWRHDHVAAYKLLLHAQTVYHGPLHASPTGGLLPDVPSQEEGKQRTAVTLIQLLCRAGLFSEAMRIRDETELGDTASDVAARATVAAGTVAMHRAAYVLSSSAAYSIENGQRGHHATRALAHLLLSQCSAAQTRCVQGYATNFMGSALMQLDQTVGANSEESIEAWLVFAQHSLLRCTPLSAQAAADLGLLASTTAKTLFGVGSPLNAHALAVRAVGLSRLGDAVQSQAVVEEFIQRVSGMANTTVSMDVTMAVAAVCCLQARAGRRGDALVLLEAGQKLLRTQLGDTGMQQSIRVFGAMSYAASVSGEFELSARLAGAALHEIGTLSIQGREQETRIKALAELYSNLYEVSDARATALDVWTVAGFDLNVVQDLVRQFSVFASAEFLSECLEAEGDELVTLMQAGHAQLTADRHVPYLGVDTPAALCMDMVQLQLVERDPDSGLSLYYHPGTKCCRCGMSPIVGVAYQSGSTSWCNGCHAGQTGFDAVARNDEMRYENVQPARRVAEWDTDDVQEPLDCIRGVCRSLYPGQRDNVEATALVKYSLGGPDPLDYVAIYLNLGYPESGVGPHWHYVSMGLSNLHADTRLFRRPLPEDITSEPSGFGFELTMRLKFTGDKSPPMWPANALNTIARYLHRAQTSLRPAEFIQGAFQQHMGTSSHALVLIDPQLPQLVSTTGTIAFLQLLAITSPELECCQSWSSSGMLKMLLQWSEEDGGPGPLGISEPNRFISLNNVMPDFEKRVAAELSAHGSTVGAVSLDVNWTTVAVSNTSNGSWDCPICTFTNEASARRCDACETPRQGSAATTLQAVQLNMDAKSACALSRLLYGRIQHSMAFTLANYNRSHFTFVCEGCGSDYFNNLVPVCGATAVTPLRGFGPHVEMFLTSTQAVHVAETLGSIDESHHDEMDRMFNWEDVPGFTVRIRPEPLNVGTNA